MNQGTTFYYQDTEYRVSVEAESEGGILNTE